LPTFMSAFRSAARSSSGRSQNCNRDARRLFSRSARFISAEAVTRAASCACAAPLTKDAPRQRLDGVRKLKLPLASALRQKQTQFASSSSNGGDVTSKLSRHRGHSLLPLREFDQQLGLLFGPFAGFCRLHYRPLSEDRNLHQ
jgi:hypothetical protein